MTESSPLTRATNPQQYDMEDLAWEKEGVDSPRISFFWEYLKKYTADWKDKNILDIGSGHGWLLQEVVKAGATTVLGIEPSAKNIALTKQIHPHLPVVQTTLEAFEAGSNKFDVITSVMAFSHIRDLDAAFDKIKNLLTDTGEVILILPDYAYFKLPRHEYHIEMHDIDDSQYAVAVTRPTGTIADIVRKNEVYLEAAKKAGLSLVEEIPMLPTSDFISNAPKFAAMKDQAITQLLKFKNS
jgi:2-polyprenyl-3-methyl-5-hydroxy-6-metoxy-1,4-benzoquinol methylase